MQNFMFICRKREINKHTKNYHSCPNCGLNFPKRREWCCMRGSRGWGSRPPPPFQNSTLNLHDKITQKYASYPLPLWKTQITVSPPWKDFLNPRMVCFWLPHPYSSVQNMRKMKVNKCNTPIA